jgi:hypothetical protein
VRSWAVHLLNLSILIAGGLAAAAILDAQIPAPAGVSAFLNSYCTSCHSQTARTAGVVLEGASAGTPELWERVVAKLRAGSMPPPGSPRPAAAKAESAVKGLEEELDRAWRANPMPGRASRVHRLNRAEFNNAIRDLFGLDIDVKPLLPGDETADGSFDNMADALSISTAHLERYMSVARQITRLAAGLPPVRPELETFAIPLHVLQEDRQSEDLPLGSRGGIAVRRHFPVDGEYLFKVRLQRQYQDYLKGMGWPQQLDIRLDGKLLRRFAVGGGAKGRAAAASYAGDGEPGYAGDPEWEQYMQVGGDAGLEVRAPIQAGSHVVGVSFVRQMWEPEGLPQPQQRGRVIANDQVYMDHASVGSVQIGGPYKVTGRPARFSCSGPERDCATRILSQTARLAYRRPVNPVDLRTLMEFFEAGRRDGGDFDSGIQFALERLLVDPDFLLRVHRPPSGAGPHRLTDLEVASRLSFFLWSSIPDDDLLAAAERGRLTEPGELEGQVRRLLSNPRSARALVDGFAAQWLNLRRIGEVVVDPLRYPNYDESLLQAFRQETELFVADSLREDRSVNDLLSADYTFVNERLARHYGIPGVSGSRFRRVSLPDRDRRGGLLAHGAMLATTSYPDRTSPVLRGKWLLNNILGLPVPPPPPGLDTSLEPTRGGVTKSIRERLAQHRRNPSCNSCHTAMDPLGFALENFDVIGGWRTKDESGQPVDAIGTTAGGGKLEGLAGLRASLLAHPDQFPRTVTEKLMSYALGRRLEYYDRPAVRAIVREAAAENYRWSALIRGIARSPAFLTAEELRSN